MPDESTNPAGTAQTSQNDQTATNQSGNDFVLDFGDLGDNDSVTTEEVQVDSSLVEEEKADDGLGFDIDLESDSQDAEEGDDSEMKKDAVNDVSVDAPEEETVNDFDISMDYEGTSEEENEEPVEDNEEIVPDEEPVEDNEEIVPDEEPVEDNEEIVPDEEPVEDNEEIVPDEEPVEDNEEIVPDEEYSSEEGTLNFVKDENSEFENAEMTTQPNEGHLFHQINEDDQEVSFESANSNSENDIFQSDESASDKLLFMDVNEDAPANEFVEEGVKNSQDLPEVSDNIEGSMELDMEIPEQRQPELGDLLSNSPIDLSKELNDTTENSESNLGDVEIPVNEAETGNETNLEQISDEVVSETAQEEVTSEAASQEVQSEPSVPVENNEFLLDTPQVEPETQNVEETQQPEVVENNVETQPEEQPQVDERSEMVNNVVSDMNQQNVTTPEINITTPVELSDVSSSQREQTSAESESQVQSTLSLDQILDSELLSNPQYADNSKASPQNMPASGGKSKKGLFIGVGVVVLAGCVAVLAFPSISSDRKPGDTVNTGTIIENPVIDDGHLAAGDEPAGEQNPSDDSAASEDPQTVDIPDFPDVPSVGGGQGGAQVIDISDDGDDSGNGYVGPVPYIGTDSGDSDNPVVEEPVVEEISKNQILDVISSFKSQAETYYSHGEQHADKQLMKYSLRLISVCDNYRDKVNNGEGLDSESLTTFKSTANKIINKINTYLGGDDEEVQIVREATSDGETYFPGKDELKDYIYNNR